MSVSHTLLGLLEPAPRHGYDLKRLFDAYFAPDRPLAFGQVYATLGRLERDGRVAMAGIEQDEGPERRRYAITPAGSEAFAAWLERPIAPEPHLQSELFAKVTLAVLTGRAIEPLLDAQRRAHLARMRELTGLRRTAALPVVLLADYALFHLEADLRWIELTAARVGDLRAEIRPLPSGGARVVARHVGAGVGARRSAGEPAISAAPATATPPPTATKPDPESSDA